MSILVFLSHKDSNSLKLFETIKNVNRFEKIFNTVDIHTEREYIQKYNIKKIPSLLYQERLYTGQNAMMLVKQFVSQFPAGENSKPVQDDKLETVYSTGFLPADNDSSGNELFAPPIDIRPVNDDGTDLQTKMDKYNESRNSILDSV